MTNVRVKSVWVKHYPKNVNEIFLVQWKLFPFWWITYSRRGNMENAIKEADELFQTLNTKPPAMKSEVIYVLPHPVAPDKSEPV